MFKLVNSIPVAFALILLLLAGNNNQSNAFWHDNSTDISEQTYTSTPDLVEEVISTVIYIFMEKNPQAQGDQFGGLLPESPTPSMGVGTGFFINDQGYIVTNTHVVKDTKSILIYYWDSPLEYNEAQVVGMDEVADIAVIKINPEGPTNYVEWGDSEQVRLGEDVVAIGHGMSMPWAVTKGVISMTYRQPDMSKPMILYNQSDTVINQGNSGGPLFNMDGEVVGVNTLLYSRTGAFSGVGFSVPSNLAKRSVDQIISTAEFDDDGNVVKQGYVKYTAIGIKFSRIETLEERNKLKDLGIYSVIKVKETPQGGAANEAGILPDDIIISIDDKEIISSIDLVRHLWYTSVGDTVKIVVYRNNEYLTLDVTLKEFNFIPQVTKGK